MADKRLCSIPNCNKPMLARGWCSAHWTRWQRHGDPLSGGTSPGDPEVFYRETALVYDGSDCLLWPFAQNGLGYAVLRQDGKNALVSRLICEAVNGPPPSLEHEAAHSCGKGHMGCVSRRHLSWKTHAENQVDKIRHGTSNRGQKSPVSKITEENAREILSGTISPMEASKKFGITTRQAKNILTGTSWSWLA